MPLAMITLKKESVDSVSKGIRLHDGVLGRRNQQRELIDKRILIISFYGQNINPIQTGEGGLFRYNFMAI